METSQQQRRPAVGQLAQTLATAKLDFDAIDLADMLWLAQFIESGDAVRSGVAEARPDQGSPRLDRSALSETGTNEPAFNLYPEGPPPPPALSTETDQAKLQGLPFSVPAAPAIRTRMDLARALRPLMRKVPSRARFELDEEDTVSQIAETEVWMPVVRPLPERWLELEFVVELSKTTAIWERAITELNHLVEYQGAFRTVRTWRLSAQGDQVQLFPRWRDGVATATSANQVSSARPHTPRELIDPTGRRLIWLVTDCTSPLWRQGIIHPALRQWGMAQPVVIVQMFPDSLWKRTALRDGHPVKLKALAPGLPSARLEVEGLPRRLERQGRAGLAIVPVVTLDAQILRHWARVIAGAGDSCTPGRVFDLAFINRQAEAPKAPAQSTTSPTAQERVDLFRATTTSATVKHLADLMAATPIVSLPVIDLLRDAFRADFDEEVRQSHVAEVLLSGLLHRSDAESDEVCRYEFWGDDSVDPDERVRDLLLGDASVSKTLEVLNVLSATIEPKINSPVKTFQALLAELHTSNDEQLWVEALPFAQVGLKVLHRLGNEHATFARQYEQVLQSKTADESESYFDNLFLQDIECEVAEFITFPPLESFEFIEAHFEEDEEEATIPTLLQTNEFSVSRPKTASQKDFFISHVSRDRAWAEWIAWILEENGYTLHLQSWDFLPGKNFVMEMMKGVTECDRTIAILSDDYLKVNFTQAEWAAAFRQDPQSQDSRLIPIRVGECKPTGLLSQIIYIDIVGRAEAEAERVILEGIAAALKQDGRPSKRPAFPNRDLTQGAADDAPEGKKSFPGRVQTQNPFLPLTGAVDEAEQFFDCDHILDHLFEVINSGSNVALIGDRNLGKSSLLREVARQAEVRLTQPREPIFINLVMLFSEDEFYEELCAKVGIAEGTRGNRLNHALRDKRLLLILDEFERIVQDEFSRRIRDQLRGLSEGRDAPLRLVLAARRSLAHLFSDSYNDGMVSPLHGICVEEAIRPWSAESVRQFIATRLAPTPVRFSDDEIADLISTSGGRPKDLMQHCNALFRQKLTP